MKIAVGPGFVKTRPCPRHAVRRCYDVVDILGCSASGRREGRQKLKRELSLTFRQVEGLRRIAAGETSAEIAAALGLSRHIVDHYISAACDRLGAKSPTHIVATAIALGWILPLG